jgi:hypothetical protein
MLRAQFDVFEAVVGTPQVMRRIGGEGLGVFLIVDRVAAVFLVRFIEAFGRRNVAVRRCRPFQRRGHAAEILQMAFADQCGAPIVDPQHVDEGVGRERQRDAVDAHAVQRRHPAGRERRAVRLANRARHVELVERHATRGDRIDRRSADRAIAVAAEMVGAQLIADDNQDVGARCHCAQFSGFTMFQSRIA